MENMTDSSCVARWQCSAAPYVTMVGMGVCAYHSSAQNTTFFTGPWIMLLTQCTVCIFYVLDFYCHCYHTANVVLHLESVAMVPLLIMNGGSKNQLWKQKIK